MDLLVVINKNKTHYIYIEELNMFVYHKTKYKSKKALLQILFTVF